jgi:mannose-6-phosphate isomerase-like protein (cupin superfamily)
MGFSINIDEIGPEEIAPGVYKRVLLKPENTGRGPPGDLCVSHYVLENGGSLTLDEPNVEYQDFIICGIANTGRRHIHANTTIFVPSGRKHTYTHAGESELHIISHTYTTPHPSHRWCKTRFAQLTFPNQDQQLMTEEFHGLVGAHRFHALDIQNRDVQEHTNPEETAYFIAGTGEMRSGDNVYKFRPGTLVYVEEDSTHWIKLDQEKGLPIHYFVMEYTEQDKMWSSRGFQG